MSRPALMKELTMRPALRSTEGHEHTSKLCCLSAIDELH